ncbi:asparagine synthase-related protein [Propioniciclava flava]
MTTSSIEAADVWEDLGGQARADALAVAACLPATGRLGVAYSGGVDSATLLAVAVRALGPDRVVALMGVSPSLAADEAQEAREGAAMIGSRLVEFPHT